MSRLPHLPEVRWSAMELVKDEIVLSELIARCGDVAVQLFLALYTIGRRGEGMSRNFH